MMSIEIRKAIPSDCKILFDLGRETFYETWRAVNTEEDLQKYMSEAFDVKKIEADIHAETINTFFIAFADELAIGYVKLRRDRTYDEFKNLKVIEIERFYISREWQRHKIGMKLMDECIRLAANENHSWMWLGVARENFNAISFYEKYGFTIFGEKTFKLGEALDTDYLMKLKLVD